ncbi:FG-GAP-like repeat-containing protein [Streptomyces sp. NPDC060194]|uniref:FG-GAP-like repeat-containing protein n=1 Tax=Streptomyces sp. NPDC060194 TaxID=3347069 RepID=UPI00364EEA59
MPLLALALAVGGSGAATGAPDPATADPYDFNGDGYGDLVLTDGRATVNGRYAAGYAAVVPGTAGLPDVKRTQVVVQDRLGHGKGVAYGGFGSDVESADLDQDGYADLITQGGQVSVFVVWGGAKKLAGANRYYGVKDFRGAARLTGARPVVGDFDGDGDTDIVTATSEANQARLRLGPFNRAGKPSRSVLLDLTPADSVFFAARPTTAGDVTGDGRDDLLVTWTHVYADEVPIARATLLYPGTAKGGFAKPVRLKDDRKGDLYGSTIHTGDVDKDGFADVVAGHPCESRGEPVPPEGGGRTLVSYGGPAGQSAKRLPQRIAETTPGLPVTGPFSYCSFGGVPSVGDADGDGYADVLVSLATDSPAGELGSLMLLRGGRKGLTLTGARHLPDHDDALLRDLDGDGAADIAATPRKANEVQILPGAGGATPTLTIRPSDLGLPPGITSGTDSFGPSR